jgi:hypothetical protein
MFATLFRRSPRRSYRTRLGLCPLDNRVVPAVVLTSLDLDGDGTADDVRIVGDGQNSKIALLDNGAGAVLIAIDANGDGDSADAGDTQGAVHQFSNNSFVLQVDLGGGNDSVDYHMSTDASGMARTLGINLGAGNDTFNFTTDGHAILANSRLSIDVAGGAGNDQVTTTFGVVDASAVAANADLGAGNDVQTLKFGGIDQHAAVTLNSNLGAGKNVLTADFDGVGKFDQAAVDLNVLGGSQVDLVFVNMHDDVGSGQTSSRFNANVDLGAGNDVFAATFDADKLQFIVDDHSQCAFDVHGGAGIDALIADESGTGAIRIDPDGLLSLSLDGGAGNDVVIAQFDTTGPLDMKGAIRIRIDGGLGNDTLACTLANNATTTGAYDVAIHGGAGNDTTSFNLTNGGGTPTFGPAGVVVLDGGTGTDTLTDLNKGVSYVTGFEK